MIDFDKFSIFSVLGKDVAKMTEQEYIRLILEKYDKCFVFGHRYAHHERI